MVRIAASVIFFALALGSAEAFHQDGCERTHDRWLEERYQEATSIKEGMTVADLRKVFTEDGGFQPSPSVRYVLRSCAWIKVDVEVVAPEGVVRKFPPGDDWQIKRVSKPYLERVMLD